MNSLLKTLRISALGGLFVVAGCAPADESTGQLVRTGAPRNEAPTPAHADASEATPSSTPETSPETSPVSPPVDGDDNKGDSSPTTATNVATAVAYGKKLVGTPYGWWYSGPLPAGAPMWTARGEAPAASEIRQSSVNCSGLTNVMLRAIGKPLPSTPEAGTGGTGAYGAFYKSVAKPFDAKATYPAGTLLGRRFRDVNDQGHVAVVLEDGKVLQSIASAFGATTPGVNTTYTVAQSNGTGYYEYVVLPEDWLAPSRK